MSENLSASPKRDYPISIPAFRDEVLALYSPPRRSATTQEKMRRALAVLERTPGVATTADLDREGIERAVATWGVAGRPMEASARRLLRILCRIAVGRGWLPESPFQGQPWPKDEPRKLSDDEVMRVLSRLRAEIRSKAGHRLFVLAALAAHAGLWLRESLALPTADVDLDGRTIRVASRSGRMLGLDPPTVEFPPELAEVLGPWLQRTRSAWVFPDASGRGPMRHGSARRGARIARLAEVGKAAGVAGVSFWALRRFWEAKARSRAPKPASGDTKPDGRKAPIPIKQFARETLADYYPPKRSRETYVQVKLAFKTILATEGVATTADLTGHLAERLIASRADRSDSTRERYTSALKTIFNLAARRGAAPQSPFIARDRRAAALDRELTAAEVGRVLSHLEASARSRDDRCLHTAAATVVHTGLTRREVLSLRPRDIDLRRGLIYIPGQAPSPKVLRGTVVPINGRLTAVLRVWLPEAGTDWVFSDGEGRPWLSNQAGDGLKGRLSRASREVGVTGVTFRSLRRYCQSQVTSPAGGAKPPELPPEGEPVHLWGKMKEGLSKAERASLMTLIAAGPEGLTMPEMNALCEYSGWRQLFIELRRDPDWEKAITNPGRPYGRRWRFNLEALNPVTEVLQSCTREPT